MDKEKLIDYLIKEKGGTREQYLSLLNKIAYHESAGTLDPTIKQKGGGPGRGKYQFEEGLNQGGITAARRTKNYLKEKGEPIPEWLEEATSAKSLDVSTLDSEQQDMLFLGNMRMHPRADFSNFVSGKESPEEFWANYHWAGPDKERNNKIAAFNESMSTYQEVANTPTMPEQPAMDVPQDMLAVQDNTAMPQQDVSRQDLMSYIRGSQSSGEFNSIGEGGRHDQNPNGGVPHGTGANGQPNTVEEGETSYNFGDDKFIFSDRVSLIDYVNKRKKQS